MLPPPLRPFAKMVIAAYNAGIADPVVKKEKKEKKGNTMPA